MAKKHTSHWANLILYPPKESLGRAGKNLTLEMSVGCAQVSQELIMPKTHFGRFDHEAVYTFLIFLRVVNPWTICQKMRYVPDLHLYSKVSKLNFENPKKFQKFWKIFFAQIFIWYALECLKMSCDNFFLHVIVIHLIFGTLLIDDIAQNLWIRATYFCTSKAGLLVEKSCYWINRTRNHFIKFRSFICESPTTRTMTTCITYAS